MKRTSACTMLACAVFLLACLGCEDKPLSITYERPAEYDISASVKRIAIAEFGGKTAEDKKCGDIAADQMASDLDAYNKKYQRYQLVDRKRLQAILDEQDLQLSISDTASAAKAGKIANVEAMIYGSVNVSTKDEQASRMSFDIATRSPKKVYYTKRYCMASVNFTMDDVSTGKTLAAVTLTREYDSDKDKDNKSLAKTLGFGGDSLPPADQVLNHLIAECVQQFVGKISPHTISISEKMEQGKSKSVATGNKLARAGDYDEALQCYDKAIAANADDDGALFNAGLICEAKGEMDKAEKYYSKAFAINPKEKYVLARKRVRQESAGE